MYGVYIFDSDRAEIFKTERTVDWAALGFEIIGSNTDPVSAENEIASLKPALVIAGTEKPQLQGIHFVKAVRKAGLDCRIVALTTWWNPEVMGAFFHGGGFDYLLKPLERAMIVDMLRRVAGKQTTADLS